MATNRRIGKYIPPTITTQSGIWQEEDLYASPQGTVVQNGLQFYVDPALTSSYPGSGTTVYDLSGNGKNATLVNLPTITGNAFTFLPGLNQYVSCGNFGSFYTQGTISFWMNSTDVSGYRNPLHSHFQGSNVGFRFEQGGTGLSGTMGMLFGTDAGSYTSHQFGSINSDTWYNITVTWNTSTNIAIGYVNGSQIFNEANTTWPTQIPSLTFGSGFSSSSERWYSGGIGAVMLYNRALSATEVAQNYTALNGRYGTITTTVPSAPTVGTISLTNATTISIPYTDNQTGGRYIQGHYISITPAVSATVTSQSNPLTLTAALIAGTSYTVKVSAYNQNGYSALSGSSNIVTPARAAATFQYNALPASYVVGDIIQFPYTGAVQTFSGLNSTSVKLEVWGASGYQYTTAGGTTAGLGGYSYGNYTNSGANLYVYCGGQGTNAGQNRTYSSGAAAVAAAAAGFNGGGASNYAIAGSVVHYGTGGSGASDIRTSASGTAYTGRLLVGGGGGGSGFPNVASFNCSGGYGGGGNAAGGNGQGTQGGYGAGASTSSAGANTGTNNCGGGTNGTSGSGAVGGTGGGDNMSYTSVGQDYDYCAAGGGGGYFGGGGASGGGICGQGIPGAGGGSGYIGGVASGGGTSGNWSGAGKAQITILS